MQRITAYNNWELLSCHTLSKLPPSVPCRSDTLKHQATPASSQGCSMVTKSLRGWICIRRSPAISFSLPELSTAWGSTWPLWAQTSWAPPVMAELVVKILPVPKHFLSASVTVYTERCRREVVIISLRQNHFSEKPVRPRIKRKCPNGERHYTFILQRETQNEALK